MGGGVGAPIGGVVSGPGAGGLVVGGSGDGGVAVGGVAVWGSISMFLIYVNYCITPMLVVT